MSKRLTVLAMVLTTILTLVLTMLLSATAMAATPDVVHVSDSAVILVKTLKDGAPLFLGAGALLVSGVFVMVYRLLQP